MSPDQGTAPVAHSRSRAALAATFPLATAAHVIVEDGYAMHARLLLHKHQSMQACGTKPMRGKQHVGPRTSAHTCLQEHADVGHARVQLALKLLD